MESKWTFDHVFADLMAWRVARWSSMVCLSWRSRSSKGEVPGRSFIARQSDGIWNYIGSTDSTLCTKQKGVKPLALFVDV